MAGQERTLLASACLIMVGDLTLALVGGTAGAVLGLVAVASGSGGLKANTTTVLGATFAGDEAARESGFALFYLGINVGALLGPLLTGIVQQTWGFAVAAAGMACGLAQYVYGRRAFAAAFRSAPNPLSRGRRRIVAVLWAVVASALALFAVLLGSRKVTRAERGRVGFIPIAVAIVLLAGARYSRSAKRLWLSSSHAAGAAAGHTW